VFLPVFWILCRQWYGGCSVQAWENQVIRAFAAEMSPEMIIFRVKACGYS